MDHFAGLIIPFVAFSVEEDTFQFLRPLNISHSQRTLR